MLICWAFRHKVYSQYSGQNGDFQPLQLHENVSQTVSRPNMATVIIIIKSYIVDLL